MDQTDQATFEEVQKIVEQQEAKLKEESDGPNLSPVSSSSFLFSLSFAPRVHVSSYVFVENNGVPTLHNSIFLRLIRRKWRRQWEIHNTELSNRSTASTTNSKPSAHQCNPQNPPKSPLKTSTTRSIPWQPPCTPWNQWSRDWSTISWPKVALSRNRIFLKC